MIAHVGHGSPFLCKASSPQGSHQHRWQCHRQCLPRRLARIRWISAQSGCRWISASGGAGHSRQLRLQQGRGSGRGSIQAGPRSRSQDDSRCSSFHDSSQPGFGGLAFGGWRLGLLVKVRIIFPPMAMPGRPTCQWQRKWHLRPRRRPRQGICPWMLRQRRGRGTVSSLDCSEYIARRSQKQPLGARLRIR